MNNDIWVVTPDTDIELLMLNLQIDNKNQITFNNVSEQETYFSSLESFKIDSSTFQRDNSTIRVELPYEEMLKYNYCRYKNNNKWYYAFITDVTYSNSYMTIARLVTDVWQTYQFDIKYGVSFIERCHVTNDEIGTNVVSEELETGEYIINKQKYAMTNPFLANYNGYLICLESTRNPIPKREGKKYYPELIGGSSNGIPSVVPKYIYPNTNEGRDMLNADIQAIMSISLENNENAIQNVYMVHPLALGLNKTPDLGEDGFPYIISWNTAPDTLYLDEDTITEFKFKNDSYTPINKKLLTYPYVYYKVSNGNGMSIVYNQENFISNRFNSIIYGNVCAGNNVKLTPINYKNITFKDQEGYGNLRNGVGDESIPLGKLPILNWGGDTYTAWLVNNSLSQDVDVANAQIKRIAGYVGGEINNSSSVSGIGSNPLGVVSSGLFGHFGNMVNNFASKMMIENLEHLQMREREIADLVPPTIKGNSEIGDANLTSGFTDFCISSMTIKPRQARRIDGYFYKYGYKVNDTDYIRINTRSKFNYIKTIGAVITGDIPQMYLEIIKSMFDNGITLWHNPNTFLEYSPAFNDNSIIGA